jgi:hypothetical protein
MFGVRETPLGRRGSGAQRRTINCECKSYRVDIYYHLILQPRAVQSHGKDWTAVADLVQRTAADCSDRFRQHIQYKETKRKGV